MPVDFPQAERSDADRYNTMKAIAFVYAGNINSYALASLRGGKSAFERSIERAGKFPETDAIVVLCSPDSRIEIPASPDYRLCVLSDGNTAASLFECMEKESGDYDHAWFAWADRPFYDPEGARKLFELHERSRAEYTFADGYPAGLMPEILARGIIPVLARMARDSALRVTRNVVFDTLKREINSFDIETVLSPVDLRQLRVDFSCDTAGNTLLCESFADITADTAPALVEERGDSLRTLPAYYQIQIAGGCPHECVYCPYPAWSSGGVSSSPGKKVTDRSDFMSLSDYSNLMGKIAAFSREAVVSLSLWGECSGHPDIVEIARETLSHPGLSLVIETTGLGWNGSAIEEISKISASVRNAGEEPRINWIVSLDAAGSALYGSVHGVSDPAVADSNLRTAMDLVFSLETLFPGAVWPQMLRLRESEQEVETFYRFWKEKLGRVIIQKHDHFCGSITDRRVADLSPLVRHPCWHIKRDMCIMLDGTVPQCREDLHALRPLGNAFEEALPEIWKAGAEVYRQHRNRIYEGLCGACDEFYTYNF